MNNNLVKLGLIMSLTLLLGAGCSFTPTRSTQDSGIWFSPDQAQSWEQKVFVGAGETEDDPADDILLDKANVLFLKFHPLDSRIIYANTRSGVYFTENAAAQWQAIVQDRPVNDLVTDPHRRGTIYAAEGNVVLKTEDNGVNWLRVYTDSRPGVSVSQLAVDPLQADRIYLGTSAGDLLTSFDAGQSWRVVESFTAATTEAKLQGKPISEILIYPRDTRQIYVATPQHGIWASFDAGQSWQNLRDYYKQFSGANNFKNLLFDETRDGALLYASSYGLLWSLDGGLSWFPVELLTPPGSVNIRAVALNPNNPAELYYANETVLYKTFDSGANWIAEQLPTTGAASSLLVDFFNSQHIYLGVEKLESKKRGLIGF